MSWRMALLIALVVMGVFAVCGFVAIVLTASNNQNVTQILTSYCGFIATIIGILILLLRQAAQDKKIDEHGEHLQEIKSDVQDIKDK